MQIKNKLLLLLVMLTYGISAAWAQQHVTVAPTTGGTVTVDNATAAAGETVTITVTPDAGYQIAKSDIVAEATLDPGNAQVPGLKDVGPNVGYKIELQGDDPASLKEARTYTFTMPEAPLNVLITAHFSGVLDYNITISPDIVNGTVTSNKEKASYQESVILTVTPAEGYELATLQATWIEGGTQNAIDATPAGNGLYTFEMPAHDVTIKATFTKKAYTITVDSGIEHGSVTAPATAEYGQEVTLTVTPEAHYMLESLSVAYTNGNPVTVTDNKFTMPAANVVVTATFKPITYNITVAPTQHGNVTAPESAAYGSEVTVTVAPEEAYELETLTYTVDGGQPVPIENGKFTMPGGNVTITATFKPATYTITVAPTEHGTVSAPATAAYGTEVNVTVTPAPGYEIDELYYTYDAGGSVPDPIFRIENGKFVMPGTNVTIVATFKAQVFNITTSVYPNDEVGSITVASSAAFGSEVEVTATPAAGYTLKKLYYTYDAGGSVPDPIFEIENGKFTMPGTDITVVAEFELAPEPVHTYTVAGEPAELFGSETPWDENNSNGAMTAGDGGIYTWTSQPTHLEGDVQFKVVTDKNWNNTSYPADNYIISNVKPGTYTVTITLNPATGEINVNVVGQADVYVFGEINGNTQFTPNDGVKMTTEDGKIYTAQVTIADVENGYSFFAFTHKLGADSQDWTTANAHRFLAQSIGNFVVNGPCMNVPLTMAYNGDNAMKIPAGEYTLTVDLENMKLTITGGTQLSYILASGVEGVDYTVINDLAVVDSHQATSQYFTSDGNDNWITLKADNHFVTAQALQGGHVSGVFSGKNLNPYLMLTVDPAVAEDGISVDPASYSLANEFTPKVDEVIIVSKAYYKASENTLRAYAPSNAIQGQSCTVDTSLFPYDFKDGYQYTVRGVINIKEPWATPAPIGMKDYNYPFQNYKLLVLEVTEEQVSTGIDGIAMEEGVKAVHYYNAAGQQSTVPFRGVNIVVKEMLDGTKVTTKMVR